MWLKRLLHFVAYTIGTFMIISTWTSFLPIHEQIFRTGVVLYLSIIYIEFVDGSFLSRMKLSVLFEDKDSETKDDYDSLMHAFQKSVQNIGMVLQSETDVEREVNLERLEQHISYMQQMDLPKRHKKTHREILQDVQELYLGMTKLGE